MLWAGIALLLTAVLTSAALAATAGPRAHDTLRNADLGVISHRGAASHAPENTLSSVRAGIEHGAEFVEVDVRLTRDGVPILMHDATVDRTTNGRGKVKALNYSQISTLDAGSWFGREHRGEAVPTFTEFLEVFTEARTLAFIELKGAWSPEAVDLLHEQLEASNVSQRVVIQSFNEDTVRYVAGAAPDTARVLLTRELNAATVNMVRDLDIDGIGAQLSLIEERHDVVQQLQAEGVGAFAYTLNDEIAWEAAEVAGVDLIVTDNAVELQAWLDR